MSHRFTPRYHRLPRPASNDPRSMGPWMDSELNRIELHQRNLLELAPDDTAALADPNRSYGWRDMKTDLGNIKGTGANQPNYASTGYGGHYCWQFSASAMNELFLAYHIDHDYMPGSGLWLHMHWEPTDATAGTVRWGFEIDWAKGHQQEAFGNHSQTLYLEQASTGTIYDHHIVEFSDTDAAIFAGLIEPDTVIRVRVFRDAAHVNDTYAAVVNTSFCDFHYRTDRYSTLEKAPDFYG